MKGVLTLGEFILENQNDFPYAKGDLTRLLSAIRLAAKFVQREVSKAGLADMLGTDGNVNIQGEEQQKLDLIANEQFIYAMKGQKAIAGIGSEELDDFISLDQDTNEEARYICLLDPLDGSSNIDVNVSVGTIFSIYRRISPPGKVQTEDFLQPGTQQVAAGYIVYGSSTMLVYTTGNGVHGFTLDPSVGVFCLSHPNIQIPEKGIYYSINEGNYLHFPKGIKKYMKFCQEVAPHDGRPYQSRYIGSLVSDFHRNLLKGGIYMYPTTEKHPMGKLRLMYECNPLAFLIEQAGGKASDGVNRILEIKPEHLHERTPLLIGSKEMVEKAEEFWRTEFHSF